MITKFKCSQYYCYGYIRTFENVICNDEEMLHNLLKVHNEFFLVLKIF